VVSTPAADAGETGVRVECSAWDAAGCHQFFRAGGGPADWLRCANGWKRSGKNPRRRRWWDRRRGCWWRLGRGGRPPAISQSAADLAVDWGGGMGGQPEVGTPAAGVCETGGADVCGA